MNHELVHYEVSITVSEDADSLESMADVLRKIADMLDEGYSGGYDPDWNATMKETHRTPLEW